MGEQRPFSHFVHSVRSSPDCVPTTKSDFAHEDKGLLLEIHCSSSILTEGLGFKEEMIHAQEMAPRMGCSMKLEAGSRRDLIFNSIENVRSCVF